MAVVQPAARRRQKSAGEARCWQETIRYARSFTVHLSDIPAVGSGENAGLRPRMVIGIDKMDADSAQRFLNEIKSIFGMPDCEFIRVRPLDYEFCKRLLRQRIAGIPESIIAFCYVMSGGAPRDTIRAARAFFDVRERGPDRIDDIVLRLITDQLEILARACIDDIAAAATNGSGFPSAALKPGWPGRTAEEMIATLTDAEMSGPLPFKFRAAIYFYATVAETFSTRLSSTAQMLRAQPPASNPGIDDVAQARNSISVNPAVAWQMVSQFRSAWSLGVLRDPGTPNWLAGNPVVSRADRSGIEKRWGAGLT